MAAAAAAALLLDTAERLNDVGAPAGNNSAPCWLFFSKLLRFAAALPQCLLAPAMQRRLSTLALDVTSADGAKALLTTLRTHVTTQRVDFLLGAAKGGSSPQKVQAGLTHTRAGVRMRWVACPRGRVA